MVRLETRYIILSFVSPIINAKFRMRTKSVLVIGSGLGGLTAAVALAQEGMRVTVLEKQPRPGGYATSFSRKGYTFDVALHAVPAGGPGEFLEQLVARLGLAPQISFVKLDRPARMLIGSDAYDIPMGYDAFFDACERRFPTELGGIRRFRVFITQHAPAFTNLLMAQRPTAAAVCRFIPRAGAFVRCATISADALLSGFVRDPSLKAFLYQPAVFLALPMASLPAINYVMMFSLLVGTGMYTIDGGGQALSAALAKRLSALGGELCLGEEVVSVDVRNGRAAAAVTSRQRCIEADAFVANINTDSLVKTLVGPRFFSPSFLSHLSRLRPSMPVLQLHAGLNRSCADLGLDRGITVAFPDADIDGLIRRQNGSFLPQIVSLIATDLRAARPAISTVCSAGCTQWLSIPQKQYEESKQAVIAYLLDRLDSICPGISSCCDVVDLATPRTFHSYTGNPAGAIVGYDCSLGMHRHLRAVSRFPVPNIHLANAWSDLFGGFLPAMRCGLRAAGRILRS